MYMGQKLQDGKKVLEMSQLHPHSKTRPVQTIHPTDLGLLPSWNSIVGPPAQEFSPSWTARKRMQERVEISWNSRKSELVKLQYNPNVYKWGIFGCPKSYCYINLYPSDGSWTLWHVFLGLLRHFLGILYGFLDQSRVKYQYFRQQRSRKWGNGPIYPGNDLGNVS